MSSRLHRASVPVALAVALVGAITAFGVLTTSQNPASSAEATKLEETTKPEPGQSAQQSPIDVSSAMVTSVPGLARLKVRYSTDTTVRTHYIRKDAADPSGCSIRGHEETEEADVEPGAGDVILDSVTYHLVRFHFHTPSEHLVQGRRAPLEQHLVHRSDDGRLLVIGVLLQAGAADEADRVLAGLPDECDSKDVELDHFNLRELLPTKLSTVRYQGSLTTEPFTEGVQWFLTTPQTVSPAGIRAFQKVFPEGDARSVQPLNGREVLADGQWPPGLPR